MRGRRAWIGLSLALLAVGCGTPPKEYFYTLSDYPTGDYTRGDLATGDAAGSNYSVGIAPVSVPEGVDRPQMVVREGGHRVEMSELHRWAEPLKSEIPLIALVTNSEQFTMLVKADLHGHVRSVVVPPPVQSEIDRAIELARTHDRLATKVGGLVAMAIPFSGVNPT